MNFEYEISRVDLFIIKVIIIIITIMILLIIKMITKVNYKKKCFHPLGKNCFQNSNLIYY